MALRRPIRHPLCTANVVAVVTAVLCARPHEGRYTRPRQASIAGQASDDIVSALVQRVRITIIAFKPIRL
jgi:hypothetical protein